MDARRQDLGRMVCAWRAARPPESVPSLVPGRGRRARLTQLDVALLLGVSERWYRALESGEDRPYSREFVDGVVRVLGLGPAQAAALHRGTGHTPPRPEPADPSPGLLDLVRRQHCVSFLCDAAWDVVHANDIAARHCPWLVRPGANVMIWAFSEESRYQLRDWQSYWAGPLLGQLRLSWQHGGANPRLDEVVRTVRGAPETERLWRSHTPTGAFPLGTPRPMYLPLFSPRPTDVRIAACVPCDAPHTRWIMLTPADGTATLP
ncbi:helix-turn-helix domain-containing protein [Streptomyces sp. p1417]|uniref:Helix-turn-helix domain-containing protein n=1 Tax=Streptomyces typhae TaxID=2681492 RepID=A0A6L6X6T2_9ACTN|nr:helix-turn-helix domain-containing protein [Streptomyces typhae]MVO89270.1 helix-turn-helix domain-containing protein [Streptomyces typhae]